MVSLADFGTRPTSARTRRNLARPKRREGVSGVTTSRAARLGFFYNVDMWWNIFDLVLIIISVVDLLMSLLNPAEAPGVRKNAWDHLAPPGWSRGVRGPVVWPGQDQPDGMEILCQGLRLHRQRGASGRGSAPSGGKGRPRSGGAARASLELRRSEGAEVFPTGASRGSLESAPSRRTPPSSSAAVVALAAMGPEPVEFGPRRRGQLRPTHRPPWPGIHNTLEPTSAIFSAKFALRSTRAFARVRPHCRQGDGKVRHPCSSNSRARFLSTLGHLLER